MDKQSMSPFRADIASVIFFFWRKGKNWFYRCQRNFIGYIEKFLYILENF